MMKKATYLVLALMLSLTMVFTTACGSGSQLSMSESVDNMLAVTGDSVEYTEELAYTLAYDMDLADDSTGFRTAGSEAEHKTADYLVGQFKELGLEDVTKEAVTVDKWQFNEAYMNISYKDKNGAAKELKIDDMVSYAAQGTVQMGGDYSNLEIVDLGTGTIDEYEAYYKESGCSDMSGKIALVGLDQWNEVWIDGPYVQAATENAAAIISYQYDGYAAYDADTINMQDICAPDMKMPCTSISLNDAKAIQGILESGSDISAELYVDNEVGSQNGTSYNVVGKIKGTANTGQQILVAGHYDKYFYGFEDDCVAVGVVAGIAKSLIDSGYQPANDIVFIAHGAEEWGRFDTSTDWAIGSWEMITTAHPEWSGKTLALLNFEMPGVDSFNETGIMRTSYEVGAIGNTLFESGLLEDLECFYPEGVAVMNDDDELPRTDCISYQFNGVPCFMPRQEDKSEWSKNRYHTAMDNNDTSEEKGDGVHSKELTEYQIALYSALAIYLDSSPALALDFNSRCDDFEAAIEGTEAYASAESVQAYKDNLAALREVATANYEAAVAINTAYEEAWAAGDEEAMAAARADGVAHNAKVLAAFQFVQDEFMGLADYGTIELNHKGIQNNLDLYNAVVAALTDGEITEDDIWIAAEINGWYEYYAYLFSEEVCEISNSVLMNEKVDSNWGGKMTIALGDSLKTTRAMYDLWNAGVTDPAEYAGIVSDYEGYIDILTEDLQGFVEEEGAAMPKLAEMLQ